MLDPMLGYSATDCALLVALDRLALVISGIPPDADGYVMFPPRFRRDVQLLAPALRERGWVHLDTVGSVLRLRFTRACHNELEVFRQRSRAAAARARGEVAEEWRP